MLMDSIEQQDFEENQDVYTSADGSSSSLLPGEQIQAVYQTAEYTDCGL